MRNSSPLRRYLLFVVLCDIMLLLLPFANSSSSSLAYKCQPPGTLGTKPHKHRWVNTKPGAKHTYIMLLGNAHSGTSSAHFLFEHENSAVSALKFVSTGGISSGKEGWGLRMSQFAHNPKLRGKSLNGNAHRWDPPRFKEDVGNFTLDLAELYLKHWDLQQPYWLENSPPEMMYYKEVVEQFKRLSAGRKQVVLEGEEQLSERFRKKAVAKKIKGMRVAVVVLVRSPCNSKDDEYVNNMFHFYDILKDVQTHGGDVFLLRFEDMCSSSPPSSSSSQSSSKAKSRQEELNDELGKYLPGFGSLHFDANPTGGGEGAGRANISHLGISCNKFCAEHFQPFLPYRDSTSAPVPAAKDRGGRLPFLRNEYVENNLTDDRYGEVLDYFGYDHKMLS